MKNINFGAGAYSHGTVDKGVIESKYISFFHILGFSSINVTVLLWVSHQVGQLSKLVLVDIPPLNMMLISLQCQNRRRLCWCALELKEDTNIQPWLAQYIYRLQQRSAPLDVGPTVCMTLRFSFISQEYVNVPLSCIPMEIHHTNSKGEKKH